MAIAAGNKPNCLVLDYAGNVNRFGAVDLIRMPKKKSNNGDAREPTSPPQKICPGCRESIPIALTQCACGFVFEAVDRARHDAAATNAAIMSTEIKPERHEVKKVLYKVHIGPSGIPCLRVQYYDGYGHIGNEHLFFSHTGFPREKAERWCEKMGIIGNLPRDTDEAKFMCENFKKPSAIWIKKSGPRVEIHDYEFENSEPAPRLANYAH